MSEERVDGRQKTLAAPYTAYQSVKTLIGTHKEHGIPGRIDRTMLRNFSGAVGSQVLTALRFLHLIDDAGHPQQSYRDLVEAYGSDFWKDELAKVLRQAYAPLFKQDLTTASPGQFNEYFKNAYPCEGETLRKGTTFFLNAARDAGIPMSPYITSGMKQRTGGTGRRRALQRNGRGNGGTQQDDAIHNNMPPPPPPVQTPVAAGDLRGQLVGKFPQFDPEWDDKIKAAWFDGFKQLVDVVDKPARPRSRVAPTKDQSEE